jgi:hypothetical protein
MVYLHFPVFRGKIFSMMWQFSGVNSACQGGWKNEM